jgi:hypothetical protein
MPKKKAYRGTRQSGYFNVNPICETCSPEDIRNLERMTGPVDVTITADTITIKKRPDRKRGPEFNFTPRASTEKVAKKTAAKKK